MIIKEYVQFSDWVSYTDEVIKILMDFTAVLDQGGGAQVRRFVKSY
jgi:hypothetical protein